MTSLEYFVFTQYCQRKRRRRRRRERKEGREEQQVGAWIRRRREWRR